MKINEVQEFNPLVGAITTLVEPAKQLRVYDPKSSQFAILAAKEIKSYLQQVEEKRKELVGPLNEEVKRINAYCKDITAPLLSADVYVRAQLNLYATEQEAIRRAEMAKIEAERVRVEREAKKRAEEEAEALRLKQEAELEAHAAGAELFGVKDGDIDQAHAEFEAKFTAECEAAEIARKEAEAIQAATFKQQQWDVNQNQIKNTRAKLKLRVIDINLIPKEFLIIQVNEAAILAVAKAGVKVAGTETYEEFAVAIGSGTRMPKV